VVFLLHTAQACLHPAALSCFDAALHRRQGSVEEHAEETKIDQISRELDWQGKIVDRRHKKEE